jgi:hypothetical protein
MQGLSEDAALRFQVHILPLPDGCSRSLSSPHHDSHAIAVEVCLLIEMHMPKQVMTVQLPSAILDPPVILLRAERGLYLDELQVLLRLRRSP